jgi:NTE family protein
VSAGTPKHIVLVLSGGGAKTAAHLGAVRALTAAGLAPTRYVGTSMGAVIATALAAGLGPDAVAERLLAIRHREVFALDRTALLKGIWARALLKPDALRRTLERLLPVTAFADLTAPLSITATDVDSGDELTFGAGGEDVPLLDALCASCALPPFFPPFLVGGRRCADGGLREVVPLAVAGRFAADLVIAVDVGSGFDTERNPATPRQPALIALWNDSQRVLMASNTALTQALWRATPGRPRLLWIRPRVREGETFATDQLRWYLAEGERAASAELAALRT